MYVQDSLSVQLIHHQLGMSLLMALTTNGLQLQSMRVMVFLVYVTLRPF